MTDQQFLNWIADRLVNVYGEPESIDFIIRLREIASQQELTAKQQLAGNLPSSYIERDSELSYEILLDLAKSLTY